MTNKEHLVCMTVFWIVQLSDSDHINFYKSLIKFLML